MTAPAASPPRLSVVIVAVTGTASVERTMRHLRAQSVRVDIEVIVVAASEHLVDAAALGADEFARFRVVAIGPITQRGAAAAAGMLAASAPVVALIEDHSFPEPTWAESLLAVHEGDWAGVGPAVDNANPRSAMSWVNFILSYGIFAGNPPTGERDMIPWHNSAYKRAALAPFAGRLGELLEWEGHLQDELRASGHRLYLEPRARTRHMNVSRIMSTFGLNVQRGRILGAQRARRERWPQWRRAIQAAAFPLFPLMQLRHLAGSMRAMAVPRALAPRVYAALGATLVVMAAAEAWGLVGGEGDAVARLEDFELHRERHLSRVDTA
jgi:hypothetical protein